MLVVCNDSGKLNGLLPNIYLGTDVIHGDIFVTKFDGIEDFMSLSDEEVEQVKALLFVKSYLYENDSDYINDRG